MFGIVYRRCKRKKHSVYYFGDVHHHLLPKNFSLAPSSRPFLPAMVQLHTTAQPKCAIIFSYVRHSRSARIFVMAISREWSESTEPEAGETSHRTVKVLLNLPPSITSSPRDFEISSIVRTAKLWRRTSWMSCKNIYLSSWMFPVYTVPTILR